MPIRQFFYFDAIECLPENVFQESAENFTPKLPSTKSRYYSQEIVFGVDFQEKICKSKYFVVRNCSRMCDGIVRVAAYAFRHDGVLCHLHTHNRPFPLLQTPYIGEGAVTHNITRTKRERVSDR
jgi:hypothetical protein